MVRAPICEVCQKTEDFLCPADEEKLKRGEISELDIKLSRILYKLDRTYRIGDKVEFVKAFDMGSFILMLVRGEMGRLIGKGGKVLRALRQAVGKPVRIVEIDVLPKKSVQDLFGNVRVLGINVVYKPEGKIYRILIPRREIKYLSFPYSDIERALDIILDAPHEIIFV